MSARDEFRPASADGTCTEAVWGPMCDEIDRLRAWKREALQIIDMWEQCYDAVEARGSHARPGEFKSKHVLKWIKGE